MVGDHGMYSYASFIYELGLILTIYPLIMRSLAMQFWIVLCHVQGFVLISFGLMRGFRGSVIIGILFVAFISWFRNTDVTYFPDTTAGDDKFEYFKKVVRFHSIEQSGTTSVSLHFIEKSRGRGRIVD